MQDKTSEAILAWGGSSPLLDGARLWQRHDSKRATKAMAWFSIEPVSLGEQKHF